MSTLSFQREQFSGCKKTTTAPRGYVGEVKENLRDGYGVYTYANSFFRYEGEWRAGTKHGFGKLKMRDGSYYEGEFTNGEITGIGTRYWANNKNFYEGEFTRGEMNGRGVMKFGNGDIYEGTWVDNVMEGEGLYTSANGSIYTGGFHCHKKHGEGTITSGDEIYKGGWINNMKHGNGFLKYQDSSTYEGQWKADLMNGEGTLIHASGITYSGLWTNNRPLLECSKMVFENENMLMLEQNDVIFSLNVHCLTDDGEITTESGRLLRVSAGVRYQEKASNVLSTKTAMEENNDVTEERRTTPFGFEIEPYPLRFKVDESNSPPLISPSPSLVKCYNEGPGNENTTPTVDTTTDGNMSTKEEDFAVETNVPIQPQRTENGRTSFISLTLPSVPQQARQANSAVASLSPDSATEARRANRGRRLSDVSATKLGDLRTTRVKPELEKVSEDGREGSGGSTRRRRTRPSKQEEKMEEIYHESYCRPGDYVIIVDDVTENPFLDISLDTIFLHVVVQPVVRKARSKTDKK